LERHGQQNDRRILCVAQSRSNGETVSRVIESQASLAIQYSFELNEVRISSASFEFSHQIEIPNRTVNPTLF